MLQPASTNIAYVLEEWIRQMAVTLNNVNPKTTIAYSEDLSFEYAITRARGKSLKEEDFKKQIPLLAFNRNTVEVSNYLGDRSVRNNIPNLMHTVDDHSPIQSGFEGLLTLNFRFYAEDMRELELFELQYNSENAVSRVKGFEVDFPDFGQLHYQLVWKPLTALSMTSNNVVVKALDGTCEITGWYFVFNRNYPRIKVINLFVKNFYNHLYFKITKVLST